MQNSFSYSVVRSGALNERVETPARLLMLALLAVLLTVIALTYDDYGFTTDEGRGVTRAERVISYYLSGDLEKTILAQDDRQRAYGGMADVAALSLQRLLPFLGLDARHLTFALFGLAGIWFVYRLGAEFVSPWSGFFAGLFLAINPMWFGYMFFNHKDIPFAACLLAATYYGLTALAGRYDSQWIWLKFGLAVGLLAGSKLIGVPMLAFVLTVLLGAFLLGQTDGGLRIDGPLLRRLLLAGGAGLAACLVSAALFYPHFYTHDVDQIIYSIKLFMNYDVWRGSVLLNGDIYRHDSIPRYYLLTHYVIGMPLFLLVLVAIGAVWGVASRQPLVIASLAICGAFFCYQASSGAVVYGGYRHFLFLLPFVTLTAAYATARAVELQLRPALMLPMLTLLSVCIIVTLSATVRLYPYQYSFFNLLVGGASGADGRFEIDGWRSAFREALRELERIEPTKAMVRIRSCGNRLNVELFPRFVLVEEGAEADYVVVVRTLRRGCPEFGFAGLPVVAEVRREGILLAKVLRAETDPLKRNGGSSDDAAGK